MRKLFLINAFSLVANVVFGVVLWCWVSHYNRVFRTMRIVSSETSIDGIVKRLGPPTKIYRPGEESLIFCDEDGVKQLEIKKAVYRYSTPEVDYFVYVDDDGFVDNIYCR